MSETLGTRVRLARVRYGMSQKTLAERVGISPQGLNMIEADKTPDPGASRIREIARVLRVSADYLLGLDDNIDKAPAASRHDPVPRRRRKADTQGDLWPAAAALVEA